MKKLVFIFVFLVFVQGFSSNTKKTLEEVVDPYINVNLTITKDNTGFYMRKKVEGKLKDFFEGKHKKYFKNPNYEFEGTRAEAKAFAEGKTIDFTYYDYDDHKDKIRTNYPLWDVGEETKKNGKTVVQMSRTYLFKGGLAGSDGRLIGNYPPLESFVGASKIGLSITNFYSWDGERKIYTELSNAKVTEKHIAYCYGGIRKLDDYLQHIKDGYAYGAVSSAYSEYRRETDLRSLQGNLGKSGKYFVILVKSDGSEEEIGEYKQMPLLFRLDSVIPFPSVHTVVIVAEDGTKIVSYPKDNKIKLVFNKLVKYYDIVKYGDKFSWAAGYDCIGFVENAWGKLPALISSRVNNSN